MSVIHYINLTYEYLTRKKNIPKHVNLILLGRDLLEVDVIFEQKIIILLTKDKEKAETSILIFSEIIREDKKKKLIKLTKKLKRLKKPLMNMNMKCEEVFTESEFYKRYYIKLVTLQNKYYDKEALLEDDKSSLKNYRFTHN